MLTPEGCGQGRARIEAVHPPGNHNPVRTIRRVIPCIGDLVHPIPLDRRLARPAPARHTLRPRPYTCLKINRIRPYQRDPGNRGLAHLSRQRGNLIQPRIRRTSDDLVLLEGLKPQCFFSGQRIYHQTKMLGGAPGPRTPTKDVQVPYTYREMPLWELVTTQFDRESVSEPPKYGRFTARLWPGHCRITVPPTASAAHSTPQPPPARSRSHPSPPSNPPPSSSARQSYTVPT